MPLCRAMRLYHHHIEETKMSDFSIKATKLKHGPPYWRTEFERIYVLAGRKPLPVAQSEEDYGMVLMAVSMPGG